jgi:hypothetical protein
MSDYLHGRYEVARAIVEHIIANTNALISINLSKSGIADLVCRFPHRFRHLDIRETFRTDLTHYFDLPTG